MGQKGGGYEREICKFLSLWWTKGKDDNVFWRSQTSGARATTRAKRGLKTFGQHSDIAATNPIGAPFTNLITVEAKRGYSQSGPGEVLDYNTKVAAKAPSTFEQFYNQVNAARKLSGAPYWMILIRRDKKLGLIYFSQRLYDVLNLHDCFNTDVIPYMFMRVRIRTDMKTGKTKRARICCMRQSDFFEHVTPEIIKKLYKERKR